jgi:predicted RNA-binding protein
MDRKPMAVYGLDGAIIVNMEDVLLVVAKDKVRHMDRLVEEMREKGFSGLL